MKYFNQLDIKTNWKEIIENEFKNEYFLKIDNFLFNNSQNNIIHPQKDMIFRCFNFFNIEDTNVVIFGQDPYYNEGQANGLAFSVDNNILMPPSLKNIFKELQMDLGVSRTASDLSDWANQGILLMNTILTVNHKKPNSHKDIGWLNFSINIINEINQKTNDVVFVLLGRQAEKFKKYINLNKHKIIISPHPSPLSAHSGFFGSKIFSKINSLSKKKINW